MCLLGSGWFLYLKLKAICQKEGKFELIARTSLPTIAFNSSDAVNVKCNIFTLILEMPEYSADPGEITHWSCCYKGHITTQRYTEKKFWKWMKSLN